MLVTAGSEREALDAATEWAATFDTGNEFAGLLYRTSFQSALAGQLFVRSIELADESGEPGTVKLTAVRDDASAAFFALPFADAVRFFRDKRVISKAEFDALQDRFRAGGFVARGLASERLQEVARDAIARLLEQGLTLPEVTAAIRSGEATLGIEPASSAYLDTVVLTNVSVSYGAGRWQAMNDPNVVALRPYTQVRTAGDGRVRPSHALLDGKVFRLGSDLAAYYARPGGFRCRCGNVTLSQRQFEARGLVETTERIPGADPDPGWEGAPAPLE